MLDKSLKIQTLEEDIPDKLQCPWNHLDEFFSSLMVVHFVNNGTAKIVQPDLFC